MTRLKRLVLLTAAVLANATGAASAAVPSNTAAPTMSGLVNSVYAAVGSPLTCGTGTWTGSPTSYEYEWFRDSDSVSTAGNTYAPVEADRGRTITCWVTASNNDGSDFALATGQPMVPAVASINVTRQPAAKIASGASAAVEYTSTYWTTVTSCLLDSVSTPCTSPITAAGLPDGQHTISITAKNWADELRTYSFAFQVGERAVVAPAPELSIGAVDAMYVGEETLVQISTDATSVTCTVDGTPTLCKKDLTGFMAPSTPGDHVLSVSASNETGGSTTKTVTFTLQPLPDMSRAFARSVTATVGGVSGLLRANLPPGWQTGCQRIGGPVSWREDGEAVATSNRLSSIGYYFCNYNGGPDGAAAGDNGLEIVGTQPGTDVLTIPIVRRNLIVYANVPVTTVLPASTPKTVAMGGVTSPTAPLTCSVGSSPFSWVVDGNVFLTTTEATLPAAKTPLNGVVSCQGASATKPVAPVITDLNAQKLTGIIEPATSSASKLKQAKGSSTSRARKQRVSVKVLSSARQKVDVSVYSVRTSGKGASKKYRYKRAFRKRLTVKRGANKVTVQPALTGNYKVVISSVKKNGKLGKSISQFG